MNTPIPYQMNFTLRTLMRKHFSQPEKFHFQGIAHLIYTSDVASTKLMIELDDALEAIKNQLNRATAIIFRRNSVTYQRHGIGHGAVQNEQMRSQGNVAYSRYVIGSSTIFAIARRKAESDLLAHEISAQLGHFSEQIRKQLCLLRFEVVELGAVGRVREVADVFATPLTIGYAGQEEYVVSRKALPVNRLDISVQAQ